MCVEDTLGTTCIRSAGLLGLHKTKPASAASLSALLETHDLGTNHPFSTLWVGSQKLIHMKSRMNPDTATRTIRLVFASWTVALCAVSPLHAHDHLEAGTFSTTPGGPLALINDADYGADYGFAFNPGAGDPGSPYEGYYYMNDLVFVAQAATPDYGGPEPGAAGLGTRISVQLLGVQGPEGAHLGFWETFQDEVDSTHLTWTVPIPLTGGTNLIQVTQTPPSPASDPYGHLHGRIFSVDQPGFYITTWRFVDLSTNGPGGGPVQSPSVPFDLYFQADLTIAKIEKTSTGADIVFAAPSNIPDSGIGPATNYMVEGSPTLGPTSVWKQVGEVVVGDDHMHTNSVILGTSATFFRLKAE